jgi:hypothetical protein
MRQTIPFHFNAATFQWVNIWQTLPRLILEVFSLPSSRIFNSQMPKYFNFYGRSSCLPLYVVIFGNINPMLYVALLFIQWNINTEPVCLNMQVTEFILQNITVKQALSTPALYLALHSTCHPHQPQLALAPTSMCCGCILKATMTLSFHTSYDWQMFLSCGAT